MFAVKLANCLMFTVSGENTAKCLEGFSWQPHSLLACKFLSALRKSEIKSLMNFEPVLKTSQRFCSLSSSGRAIRPHCPPDRSGDLDDQVWHISYSRFLPVVIKTQSRNRSMN